VEAADSGAGRALGERRQQSRAHPVALPIVDHRDRDLSRFEVVLEADVTGDPHRLARRRRERDHRLVVPVVDVEKPRQLAWRQIGLRG